MLFFLFFTYAFCDIMVELLAPAGNFISLASALKNGADAVYIGLEESNMRINASNFSVEDIGEASRMCRDYNAKLYVCANTIMKDRDIERLEKQLPLIKQNGADGIILSDIALIDLVLENGLEAHMSVQENTTNSYALKALEKLGVKRAILSRELSLDEIKKMVSKLKADGSKIQTEVFIHGAMCMAISGRCFLSYGLYGRSANCGDCLQPCRKEWTLHFEESGKDDVINLENQVRMEKKVKDDFMANTSHELRTPVNTISGMCEILLQKNLLPKIMNLGLF